MSGQRDFVQICIYRSLLPNLNAYDAGGLFGQDGGRVISGISRFQFPHTALSWLLGAELEQTASPFAGNGYC